jgi:hypothetical protein
MHAPAAQGKVLGLELAGAFKRRYMTALLAQGLVLAAAYGNTLTGAQAAALRLLPQVDA